MKLYVAGPMRGYEQFNFPAFDYARDWLLELGHEVTTPADLDRAVGFDPNGDGEGFDMEAAFDRDVAAIKWADGILLLKGHERSVGATAEKHIGRWLGKEIFVVRNGLLVPYEFGEDLGTN